MSILEYSFQLCFLIHIFPQETLFLDEMVMAYNQKKAFKNKGEGRIDYHVKSKMSLEKAQKQPAVIGVSD